MSPPFRNQRTNGPVNAHLISGPTVSTKTNKIGKSQPRVIIYINFVELESPMLKIIGLLVLEKKIFKGFYHIWAWRPSWPCDLYHLVIYINFLSHFPRRIHMKFGIDWPIGFREEDV